MIVMKIIFWTTIFSPWPFRWRLVNARATRFVRTILRSKREYSGRWPIFMNTMNGSGVFSFGMTYIVGHSLIDRRHIRRLMFVETHSPPEYAMKYYGNVTNPGAHFTLNDNMFHLDHKPAKIFVDTLSDWLNLLPPDAWSSWTVRVSAS